MMISIAKKIITVIIIIFSIIIIITVIIRFGLWTWEWITAEEAERLANDGDPILEPVCLIIIIIIISSYAIIICYHKILLHYHQIHHICNLSIL